MRRHGQSPVHRVPSAERQWCLHALIPIRRVTIYAPSSARTAIIRKEQWCISSRHLGRGRNLTCPSPQPRLGSPEPGRHRAAAHSICSSACRQRRPRGGDLSYLTTLSREQAKARRSIHVVWPALRAETPKLSIRSPTAGPPTETCLGAWRVPGPTPAARSFNGGATGRCCRQPASRPPGRELVGRSWRGRGRRPAVALEIACWPVAEAGAGVQPEGPSEHRCFPTDHVRSRRKETYERWRVGWHLRAWCARSARSRGTPHPSK
jgi:hypothetical protein